MESRQIRVIAALYPRALATSLALPMDVLQAAGSAVRAMDRRSGLSFQFAATGPDAVDIAGGMSLQPELTFADMPACDLLLLPAMWRNPQPVVRQEQVLVEQLPELHAAGTAICAVGTGSCLLAASGLLDHRAATTHWHYFDEFARHYPLVHLKRRHLITEDGSLFCAGSVNSGADLMIHLVEGWFGQRIARQVENQFSPEIRRPFRAHAYQSVDDSAHHDELVLTAQQWLQDQLHESVSMEELASQLDCSARTLTRRFKSATGVTPSRYLQTQRLAAARELLRTTNLSVGEVAFRVGLHDVSYFTNLFRKHNGLTPGRYRKSVRGKIFSPGQG